MTGAAQSSALRLATQAAIDLKPAGNARSRQASNATQPNANSEIVTTMRAVPIWVWTANEPTTTSPMRSRGFPEAVRSARTSKRSSAGNGIQGFQYLVSDSIGNALRDRSHNKTVKTKSDRVCRKARNNAVEINPAAITTPPMRTQREDPPLRTENGLNAQNIIGPAWFHPGRLYNPVNGVWLLQTWRTRILIIAKSSTGTQSLTHALMKAATTGAMLAIKSTATTKVRDDLSGTVLFAGVLFTTVLFKYFDEIPKCSALALHEPALALIERYRVSRAGGRVLSASGDYSYKRCVVNQSTL